MIKTSVILFILLYLTSAHAAQTVDKLNSNQLILLKETASKALILDSNKQIKSSSTSSTELGYLSGVSSSVQDQIDDKANDDDAAHLTGDESISGVKTLTGKLVTSSTTNASIPCPVMTQTQRDSIATPVTGDCVFNSDTSLSNIYDGAIWKAMGGSGGGISLWITSNGYAVDDVVIESNNIYICLTAHTSGTFASDLASLYWLRLSTDVTGATGLLPLSTGGTNKSITPADGSIVYSDADSFELLSGTSGQTLQSNGSSAPSFVNKSIVSKAQNKTAVTSEEIQFPNNLLTETGTNKYLSESGNKNILDNPSFEHSTFSTSWTNSVGTFTQELTSVIDGKASAKLVLSAQTMSLTQSSTLYAAQFADGVQGLAMVRIKSDIALKVCSIQAGTVSTTNCVNTNTDSKWGLYKIPFILGATSNGISIASSGSVTGTVYTDDAFVGAQDLTQNITACNSVDCETDFSIDVSATGVVTEETGGDWISSCTNATTPICTFNTGIFTVAPHCWSVPGVAGFTGYENVVSSTQVSIYTISNSAVAVAGARKYFCKKQGADYTSAISRSNGNTYSSNNADTDWASCGHTTSSFTGFGTVTAIETQCKRQGSDLLMKGKVTTGTSTAVEARISLPIWQGTQLVSANTSIIPSLQLAGDSVDSVSGATYFRSSTLIEPSVSYITFGLQTSTINNALTKINGNNLLANSAPFSFTARIPINGWNNSNIIIGSFNGLQTCVDTVSCTDTFSAKVSSAGIVSDENTGFIAGNCALTDTSLFTCTWNTSIFSVAPNCVASMAADISGVSQSASTATVSSVSGAFRVLSGGAKSAQAFNLVCQKQGADYIGKTAMAVASDQNLRTPGVTDGVVYSGIIGAAGGAVSSEVGDLINGSCSGTTTKTCTLNSGAIDNGNCTCSVSGSFGECRIGLTSSTITVLTSNSAGVAADVAVNYICHGIKQ